jgi:uncharacterized repeat protein (TIGR01451 family)
MGTRSNDRRSGRATRRGLATCVSFLLLFAFALGQGSSLFALADDASTDPVATEDVVSDGVSADGSLPSEDAPAEEAPAGEAPVEEAPAEEAPAEDAPVEDMPAVDVGSGSEDSSDGEAASASADRTPAAPAPGDSLQGGDISLDFVAAGPFTYDHTTGLGARPQFGYDNRNISKTNGVVESLEGGDFECDDLVTFFVQVAVDEGAGGSGAVELDMSFGAETTGQPGLGFDNIVSVAINSPDDGNVGLDGTETATLSNEHADPAGYDEIKGTVTVTGLDPGESAIVRIIVHLECELGGAGATGNILNAIDAARVVGDGAINVGQETVPMKQVGGLAAQPGIDVTKDCPASAAAGEEITYEITVTNVGNVDLSNITVVDDIIGDLSDEFPDTLAVGSDPVTVLVPYAPLPDDGDPVTNTVTATGDWQAGETSDSVSDTAECTTDITHEPGIDVTKACPELVGFGEDISYTITVENTGNEALEGVTVNDTLLGDISAEFDFDFANAFPVGEVTMAIVTYSPGAEEDPVLNTVTASGIGEDSGVEASAEASCTTDVSNPAILIVKTVSDEVVPVGTTVTYTYVVTNIGDVTLFDITVIDDIMGPIGVIARLDPGESETLTKDFVVGDEPVLNVAVAEGHDILGRVVRDDDDAFVTPIAGANPPPPNNPPTPFTGSDAGRLGLITIVLFAIGVTVVASTRRRRPEREAA